MRFNRRGDNYIDNFRTLRRFFSAIDTTQFQRLFIEWIQAGLSPEVQVKTSETSNEITAIPELLEWLDVRGAIDAMGCHLCPRG